MCYLTDDFVVCVCTVLYCTHVSIHPLVYIRTHHIPYASLEDGHTIQGVGLNNEDGKAGGIYVEGFFMFCCVILGKYKGDIVFVVHMVLHVFVRCCVTAMQYKVVSITCTWTWIHVTVWLLSLAGKCYGR